MKAIWLLIRRYFQYNKRKAVMTGISIWIAMAVLTAMGFGFSWAYDVARMAEIEENGSWHAIFRRLTQEQCERLRQQKDVKSVQWEEADDGSFDATVEYENVGGGFYGKVERTAKKIGMRTLTEMGREKGIRPDSSPTDYDIVYHTQLVEFYGVRVSNDLPIQWILVLILVFSMAICAIFIYNAFEVSYLEKRKYLGLLAGQRASRAQKRWFILGEGLLIGVAAVPAGLLTGICVDGAIVLVWGERIQGLMKVEEAVLLPISILTVLGLLMLGFFMVFLSCIRPAVKAGELTVRELMSAFDETEQDREEICKYYRWLKPETNLAIRNLRYHRKRTLMIVFLVMMLPTLTLNGYVYSRIRSGDYALRDERDWEHADAWVSIYTEGPDNIERVCEDIQKIEGVEHVSHTRGLNLNGIFMKDDYIMKDPDELGSDKMGTIPPIDPEYIPELEGKYYGFQGTIIGLTEECFREYADRVGISEEEIRQAELPAIFNDYILIRGESEGFRYRRVLELPTDRKTEVIFGKYADLTTDIIPYYSELETLSLDALCATEEIPPVSARPEDLESHVGHYSQWLDGCIKIYVPDSTFQRLLEKEELIYTHEPTPPEKDIGNTVYNFGAMRHIYIKKEDRLRDGQLSQEVQRILAGYGLYPYQGSNDYIEKCESDTWVYNSIERIRAEYKWEPVEYAKKSAVILSILLFSAFTLSALINYILTSLVLRKREFSVYRSVGMRWGVLKKMMATELLIQCVIGLVAGILFANYLAFFQYYEYNKSIAARTEYPFAFLILEIVALCVGIVALSLYAVRKVGRLNIIEAIKNESL